MMNQSISDENLLIFAGEGGICKIAWEDRELDVDSLEPERARFRLIYF